MAWLTFLPVPEGQPVKQLRRQIHGAKQEKINPKEEGSQKNMNGKIPEGQVHAPRLEPTAPIRLADRNHAHYPSRHRTILNKRRLDDGLPAHAIRSTQESSEDVTRTLDRYIYIYIEKIVGASSARMEKMPQLGLEPISSSLRG